MWWRGVLFCFHGPLLLPFQGLYEAFAEEARVTGREKLLLTMATASGTYFINTSYEPRKIIK